MAPLTQNQPWYVGFNGATNFTRHEAQKFARQILDSADYRASLETRARRGDLPPAVETMLWHYAYGKPIEQVALTVQTEDLSSMSTEDLLKRYEQKLDELREAEAVASAIPAEVVKQVV